MTPFRLLLSLAASFSLVVAQTRPPQFTELRKMHFPSPTLACDVALGDVDGDGDIDAVFASPGTSVGLARNDGPGVFTYGSPLLRNIVINLDPRAVALGDVDGDGDLDLVIGCWGRNRLFLNDGRGRFTDATTNLPPDTDATQRVLLVDVDGDRDLDLVTANGDDYAHVGQQNRLYLNDGRGHFTDVTATHMPVDADISESVTAGDIDGDGDVDLVFGNSSWMATLPQQARVYVNDGQGHFTDATATALPPRLEMTRCVLLVDVDGDGDLDLVQATQRWTGDQTRLYLNDGRGRFSDVTATQFPALIMRANFVAAADVDGDGDQDLAFACFNQETRLWLNDSRGRFTDATATRLAGLPPRPGFMIAAADVDGDGDLDLVQTNTNESLTLLLNHDAGLFADGSRSSRVPLSATGNARAVLPVDVDGDGDLDLVIGDTSWPPARSLMLELQNDGFGAFTDVTGTRMPMGVGFVWSLAAGDVDGDGDPDLVVGLAGSSPLVLLYLNDGTGRFTDVSGTNMPSTAALAATIELVDVDRDRDLDIVVADQNGGVRLYLNDGRGRFMDVTATHIPPDTSPSADLAVADVDGDGRPDLVVAKGDLVSSGGGAQDRLFLNNGNGTFRDATATNLPADNDLTPGVTVGDVDGDGDIDIVFGNTGGLGGPGAQNRLLLNDGAGVFQDATQNLPPIADTTMSVVLVDVDSDGDLDLVVGDFIAVTGPTLLVNDGAGVFRDAAQRIDLLFWSRYPVVPADLDGDGDTDLLFGDSLALNLHRQLHAPLLARLGRSYPLDCWVEPGYGTVPQPMLVLLSDRTLSPRPRVGTLGLLGIDPRHVFPPDPVSVYFTKTTIPLAIPNAGDLLGVHVVAQGIVFPTPNTADWRFTNVTEDVIVR